MIYRNYIKNLLDYILGFLLLIFFSPIIIIIYLILNFKIGSPIFKQKRPGLNNKSFTLYKFKTILDKNCKNFNKKKKYFKLGYVLRTSGLDELPQLVNILKGELSIVGPRPLRMKYLKIKAFKSHLRRKCKPGITGLAQIENYYNDKKKLKQKWKINFKLDKYYCCNLSFVLDLKILFLTFIKIISFSKNDFINEPKLLKGDLK